VNKLLSKISVILTLTVIILAINSCSGTVYTKKNQNLKYAKYFKILADSDDDKIFIEIQQIAGIEPLMERYTIIADLRATNIKDQYILIGDESNWIKLAWDKLPEHIRNGLINWNGSNKEEIR
jgi:hypothetical protein